MIENWYQELLAKLHFMEAKLRDIVSEENAGGGCTEDGCGCVGSQIAHAHRYVADAARQLEKVLSKQNTCLQKISLTNKPITDTLGE